MARVPMTEARTVAVKTAPVGIPSGSNALKIPGFTARI